MALITARPPAQTAAADPSRTAFAADDLAEPGAPAAWREPLRDCPDFLDLPWDRPWAPADGAHAEVRVPLAESAARILTGLDADPRAGWALALGLLALRFTGQRRIPLAVCGEPPATCCVLPVSELATAREGVRVAAAELARADALPALGRAAFAALLRPGRAPDAGSPFNLGLVLGGQAGRAPIADVVLYVPVDPSAAAWLGYSRRLLDPASAQRLAEHLSLIVRAVADDPDADPSRLELLPPAERRPAAPLPAASAPTGPALSERVRAVARRTPDAVALCYRGAETSYARLDAEADRLAHRIAELGVRQGERVALLLERSPALILAELAVMRVGAVAVPLDPGDDDAWIRLMVRDCAPVLVLTDTGLAGRLPGGGDSAPRTVLMDGHSVHAGPDRGAFHGPEPTGASPSHLYYTSGSTGLPKAVAATHAAIIGLADWAPAAYGIDAASTVAWVSAPGFAISRLEWMPALGLGARIEVADASDAAGPERLRDWLSARRVTHALLTTSVAERVWSLPWPEPTALRLLLAVGEPVRRGVPADLPFTLALSYGSTEAAVVTSTYDAARNVDTLTMHARAGTDARPDAVGRPIPGTRVEILDGAGRPVPHGVTGEIFVEGFGIADPGRPDGLLATGDLGRIWPDGSLDVLGRTADLGWISGRAVHGKAVERALLALPGVGDAAVLARRPAAGRARTVLAAYIVPEPGARWSPQALLRGVADALPVHARPLVWIPLDALPRLANGKLDRRTLASLGASRALLRAGGPEQEPEAPPTPAAGWRAWCSPTDWS